MEHLCFPGDIRARPWLPYGLALAVLVSFAPRLAHATCNLIPGTIRTFNSSLGAANRPFAGPGEAIEVYSRGCDNVKTGLSLGASPQDQIVTVLFTPPGKTKRNAVILTAAPDCSAINPQLKACASNLQGGAATCIAGASAGLARVERDGIPKLSFRFPDTDAALEGPADDLTFAGPATIVVSAPGLPLPCGFAKAHCSVQPGVIACIDEFFADDGSCGTAAPNRTFSHFTGLPPPNNYSAACTTEDPPCDPTPNAGELRLALDADGNALVPFNWQGILVRQKNVPVARLVRATLALPIRIPGASFLGSFAPEGARLATIFEPQVDPTAPDDVLTVFGSADAPYTVLRFGRRGSSFLTCAGGGNDGLPCEGADDCPSGTCGASVCVGGDDAGAPCAADEQCEDGECGPALFDLQPLVSGGGVGPIVLSRLGSGVCEESPAQICDTNAQCGAGPCVGYKLEAQTPVPLEGLEQTEDASLFTIDEFTENRDRNGDGDTFDSVVTLRNRESGALQSLGAPSACGVASNADGRAVIRVRTPPFSFPAVAGEGSVVGLLESEAATNDAMTGLECDANSNGNRTDAVLRVFRLGGGEITAGLVPPRVVDVVPVVNGRSLAVSGGRVFFRTPEAANATQQTTRVSVDSNGNQVSGASGDDVAISGDGRFVAFTSLATDLVAGDLNGSSDVFVHDRETGDTVRVSVDTDGVERIADSLEPSISGDGRLVVFSSTGAFVVGDGNGAVDVFLHDRDVDDDEIFDEAGEIETTLVSVAFGGGDANDDSLSPAISSDGEVIAFISSASNLLAPGVDLNMTSDVFVRVRQAGTTERVSVSSAGTEASSGSGSPAISADGRFVAFTSSAEDLVGNDDNFLPDIFVRDRAAGRTVRVSVDSEGGQADGFSEGSQHATISGDGRIVAFESEAANLVPGDTNGVVDVFLHDRDADGDGVFDEVDDPAAIATVRVSEGSNGEQGDAESRSPMLSGDGRRLVFTSASIDFVAGDSAGLFDVFLHDRLTAATARLSGGLGGTDGNAHSGGKPTAIPLPIYDVPAISADGRFVAFESFASNLVTGDTNVCTCTFCACPGPGCCGDVFVRGVDPDDLGDDRFADGRLDDTVLEVLDAAPMVPGPPTTLCPATQVAAANGKAAFLRPESVDGTGACPGGPLNGDGNVDGDEVVQFWSGAGAVLNLGRAATLVELSVTTIVALVSEAGDGVDYNNDNDASDTVVQTHPPGAGVWTSVARAADTLALAGSTVAFLTPEAGEGQGGTNLNAASGDGDMNDRVVHVYDAAGQTLVNLGQAAEELVLGEPAACDGTPIQIVAFRTSEQAQGTQDLNGDGDQGDDVLQVYDALGGTGAAENLGRSVIPCRLEVCDPRRPYRVNGAQLRFLTFECDEDGPLTTAQCPTGGKDLNGDDDPDDLVLQVFDFCQKTITVVGAIDPVVVPADPLEAVDDSTTIVADQAGRCQLGVSCNPSLADPCGPGAICEADTCDAATDRCAIHTGVSCSTDADCHRCVLVQPASCLADADCPFGSACDPSIVVAASTIADGDDDGIPDDLDNCPAAFNSNQSDADEDGIGDACDTQTCGNGTRELSEQCDDGNVAEGDGCTAACTLACRAAPVAGCRKPVESGKATLALKNKTTDSQDQLQWKWVKGSVTTKADFGNPLDTEAYRLCIYDGAGVVLDASAPAGDTCGGKKPKPCWKGNKNGFIYLDKNLSPGGIKSLILGAGTTPGKAKITLLAQGSGLGLPDLSTLTSPVTVQLLNSSGTCWEAKYSAPFKKVGAEEFKDLGD